ncbi:unnamed protein product [Meganyctiphanes norvegica]|uniref:Gag protein n=1 Tax=Meganyctiphanes norvegica TaxID=48144 RepID=A0AAV2SLG1_MEGNR
MQSTKAPQPYCGSIMSGRHSGRQHTDPLSSLFGMDREALSESDIGLPLDTSPSSSRNSILNQGERGGIQGNQDRQQAIVYKQPLPKPTAFTGEGDRTFESFLELYEPYAASKWGNCKISWRAGLEELMGSWALKVYRSLVARKKNYDEIVIAVKKAFNGVKDPLGVKKQIELEMAVRQLNEPLSVFHMRISNLVAEAYPDVSEYDREVRVRESFLRRIPEAVVNQIANYCIRVNDFSNEAIYEGALLAEMTPRLVSARENKDREEEINVVQLDLKKEQEPKLSQREPHALRCYICGGSWHPVSTCELYNVLFKCVLCKAYPHPVNECPLFEKLEKATNWQYSPRTYGNPSFRERSQANQGSRYGERIRSSERQPGGWNNYQRENSPRDLPRERDYRNERGYYRDHQTEDRQRGRRESMTGGWGSSEGRRSGQNSRPYNYGNAEAAYNQRRNWNQHRAGNE